MPGNLPGLALVPACVGMAIAWTWVVATFFVGQELAMHDTSQSCMLGGAAAALAVFAMLDLAGTRGPEFNRGLMRVLSCLVAGVIVVDIYLPGNPSLPAPLIAGAWMLLGVFGAYTIRRSFHLLASLATWLGGRSILRVACAGLASAAVLSLMASNMPAQEAAVVMIASVPVALWLLPQGRLMLGWKHRRPGKHASNQGAGTRPADCAGEADNRPADDGTAGDEGSKLAGARVTGGEGARPQPTDAKGAEKSGTSAGRPSSLPLKQLAPYAFTFIAMGFTCGFHTSVGRVLYIDYEHFNLVFLAMLAACTLCACLAKRPGFARRAIPAIALQIPLACACVAFVPLLFLSDRPDNVLWELIQNTLVFLSSWSLLVAISLLTCADATGNNKMAPCATPYCAVGVATFALGLFIGWLVGQNSFAEYGASGIAFRLGVTACIALLVSSLLAASTHITQGATEPSVTSDQDNRERTDAILPVQAGLSETAGSTGQVGLSETAAWSSSSGTGGKIPTGQSSASESMASRNLEDDAEALAWTGGMVNPDAILPGRAGLSEMAGSTGQVGLSEVAAWTGRADNKPQTTDAAGQADIEAKLVRTSPAGNGKPPASIGQAGSNESVASTCQTSANEPAASTGLPGYGGLIVTATQAGHERGNVLANQAGCDAGTRVSMKSSAEVEGAVNAGAEAHAQPLSYETRATRGGGSMPLSPEAAGIQAAPCTPPCPTPCTCATEAAVDSVALHFGLSEREHSLLMLLAEGLTAQQAADRLTVSRNTVKSHMAHIYTKCNVHTRAELNELLEAARRL